MNDVKRYRIDEHLINDLMEAKKSNSEKTFYDFMQWTNDEYINFMLIGRSEYKATLNHIIANHSDCSELAKILLHYIDNYGATKSFYTVSSNFLNERVTNNTGE